MLAFPDPEQTEQRFIRQFLNFRAQRVLELGCGDGRTFSAYVQETAWLVGLDNDQAELRTARQQWPAVPLIHGDAVTLPFADSSFDVVLWSWAL